MLLWNSNQDKIMQRSIHQKQTSWLGARHQATLYFCR